jgi:hypothetical protein
MRRGPANLSCAAPPRRHLGAAVADRRLGVPALLAAAALALGACVYPVPVPVAAVPVDPTAQAVGTGAALGAGAGALIGSASGEAGTGAAIGAGVGALSGYLIEQDRRRRWEDQRRERWYGTDDWRYRRGDPYYPYY